jgi:GNAT superfamily N-acetyltransferase
LGIAKIPKKMYNYLEVINLNLNELNCINENINLDEYIDFREKVKKQMEYPEWLGDLSKDDLIKLINSDSKIWIYYLNEEPICSMMLIPSDEKSLLKLELTLDYKEVAEYGPMFVNPKYVGHGLQYQMLSKLDKYCSCLGYKYAASTIHPDNIYSITNFIKDNFEHKNTKTFKRGIRNIYLKQLID